MIQEKYHQAGGAAVLTKSKNIKLDGLPLLEGLRTGEQVMMVMMTMMKLVLMAMMVMKVVMML